jgi:hypothetical protein
MSIVNDQSFVAVRAGEAQRTHLPKKELESLPFAKGSPTWV